MIKVYPPNETNFTNNGIKILNPQKAKIRKEDNGDFYVEIEDKIDNIEFYVGDDYLQNNILSINTPWNSQYFRIKNMTFENKKIKIKAWHVFYDSQNFMINDTQITAQNCNYTLDNINSNTDTTSPFTTISDITNENRDIEFKNMNLKDAIFKTVKEYGGHLIRNNFRIEINKNIGKDAGVTLSYGKNIINMKIEEDWDDVCTKIMPIGKDNLTLPEIYLTLDENLYNLNYTKKVKFEQNIDYKNFIDPVTGEADVQSYKNALIDDLRSLGGKYLNEYYKPKINYEITSYIKNISDIGDVIIIKHPKLKIDIQTNVTAIEYDAILNKITKIEYGDLGKNLRNLISKINSNLQTTNNINSQDDRTYFEIKLEEAMKKINNIFEGSYVIYDGSEILVLDAIPKEDAKNVMKINSQGIGFSTNGINGPFNSVWTIDGILNLPEINVININADQIKGGTLKLGGFNNVNGRIEVYDASEILTCSIDKDGLKIMCHDKSIIEIDADTGLIGYSPTNETYFSAIGDIFKTTKLTAGKQFTIGNKIRYLPVESENNYGVALIGMT